MAASVALAQSPGYIIDQNQQLLQLEPSSSKASRPAGVGTSAPAPALPIDSKRVRIGLLLPLESAQLGQAAQIVKAGFDSAAKRQPQADISVQALGDEQQAVTAYQTLVQEGASVIIGPLTREGAANVAQIATVPTVVLNTLPTAVSGNKPVWSLALAVEAEVRQLQIIMRTDGRKLPLVIADGSPLSERMKKEFTEHWNKQGIPPQVISLAQLGSTMPETLAAADSVFLALGAEESAQARSQLPQDMPAYATSMIVAQQLNPVLTGVHYVDMPWLLMPEHPGNLDIQRSSSTLSPATERLYALGVDAFRLAWALGQGKSPASIRLDGVTGALSLGKNGDVQRQLPRALYSDTP